MHSRAQRDSPVLELLTLPGEYDWMIRQLPVINMISMSNFMDIWSAIQTLLLVHCCNTIPKMTYSCVWSLLLLNQSSPNLVWICCDSHWLTSVSWFTYIFFCCEIVSRQLKILSKIWQKIPAKNWGGLWEPPLRHTQISIGRSLRFIVTKLKVSIAHCKIFVFWLQKKIERGPRKLRSAYKTYTYATYIRNSSPCLMRWHVLKIPLI